MFHCHSPNTEPLLRSSMILIVLLMVCSPPVVLAEDHQEVETVTAVVPAHFPPQYLLDDSGKPAGFAIDILEEAARGAGLRIRYRIEESFAKAAEAYHARAGVIIPNSGITPKRQERSLFTTPVETFLIRAFKRAESTGLETLEDIAGRKVVVVRTNVGIQLMKEHPEWLLQVAETKEQALFALLSGTVDVWIYPAPTVRRMLIDSALEGKLEPFGKPLKEIKRGIRVIKERPDLARRLDAAVVKLLKTERYRKIYEKWYGRPAPFWSVQRVSGVFSALLVLVILVGVFLRNVSLRRLNRQLEEQVEERTASLRQEVEKHRAAEALLRKSECSLAEAQQLAQLGSWELDLLTGELSWSDEVFRIFERDPDRFGASYSAFLESIHPEDRLLVDQTYSESLRTQTPYEIEHRLLLPGGEVKTVHERCRTDFDEAGTPLRSVGTVQDITERAAIEKELSRSEALLERIFFNVHTHIAYLDPEFNFLRVNDVYARATGRPPEFYPGRNHFELFPSAENEAIFQRVVDSGEPYIATAKAFSYPERPDDVTYWDWTISPVKDGSGNVEGLVLHLMDVTRRTRTEIALREAVEQAEAARETAEVANRTKSEFLAAMSHEIRTPMNVVAGLADVLLESEVDDERRDYLNRMQRAGSALLELIDSILDLSKIEAGHLTLRGEPINPAEIIEESAEMMGSQAAAKGLEFKVKVDPRSRRWVSGDDGRLRQIVLNLLGNAIKFTERGTVAVSLEIIEFEGKEGLRLAVSDTGIGMGPEHLETIFQNFTQVDSSYSRRYSGTGLGLAITRQLVSMMGGRIRVESEPERGSIFYVDLPTRPAEPPEAMTREHPEESPRERVNKGRRILLAEDSEDNQLLVETYLKRTPHRLVKVMDGEQAVERAEAEPFDLILMDIQMPVMDGYRATRAIRDRERESGRGPVPIVALTAHALQGDKEKSLAAGCDGHLTKPIKKAKLLEAIERFSRTDGV